MTILHWDGGGSTYVRDDLLGYNLRAREKHRAAQRRLRRLLFLMVKDGRKMWGCKTKRTWRKARHHERVSMHWFKEMQKIVPHMKDLKP